MFSDYFNIKKMIESKREYKRYMARVEAMPKDYQYVFKKIQTHMWMFTAGTGYDMMKIHYDLVELFEEGVANGKHVLEITGEDVAGFCEELLRSARTYTADWREKLNRDIGLVVSHGSPKKLGKGDDLKD
jgi:DNA-binding ferritin-like protein (Dps family)